MPQPFCQPKSGKGTRSSRFPSTFLHKLIPGAPACVNARSIQASLSKSNATTPTAGGNFSFAKSIPSSGVNFPSRGFSSMDAPCAPPASTKSIARSLLKSVVTSPAPVAAAPRAVSVETSVNVLFPLLRHKKLCAAPPADSDSAGGAAHNFLWRNNGNSTFTDVSTETALGAAATGAGLVTTDFNNDRAIDFVLAGGAQGASMLLNPREREVTARCRRGRV